MSLPSPVIYYDEPSFFHAANRPIALRNAILLNVGYAPIYFLAFCTYRSPRIATRYKTTIVFAGYVQYICTLPYTIFNSWLALYVDHEVETTVLWCTLIRMGISVLNFISFNALTAIGFSRLISIVFGRSCGNCCNTIVFFVSSLPMLGIFAYMFIVSRKNENEICGPMLFYYELTAIWIWNGYLFAAPLVAVCINVITAAHLAYRKRINDGMLRSQKRAVNELFVALALLAQSVIPALTISSKGYKSMSEIFGFAVVGWLNDAIDTSGYITTGLNMTVSMLFIQHFRTMLKQLIVRNKSSKCAIDRTTTNSVTAM